MYPLYGYFAGLFATTINLFISNLNREDEIDITIDDKIFQPVGN
tara:strand:+ start:454 stop:585 length:132 start_codon:yes stop_codon:yes gene_type:complete